MKKLNILVSTLAIAATLGFSSCKDDDEKSKAPDNKFTLESLSEKITDAALIYDESAGEDDAHAL